MGPPHSPQKTIPEKISTALLPGLVRVSPANTFRTIAKVSLSIMASCASSTISHSPWGFSIRPLALQPGEALFPCTKVPV